MKKRTLKSYFVLAVLILFFSCDKKVNMREAMMTSFVEQYNNSGLKAENETMKIVKATQTSPTEITLNATSDLSKDQLQASLVKSAISDLMIQMIRKNPKNLQLLDKGVNFRVHLIGKNGEKITTEIINKSSMTAQKPDFSRNEKYAKLNQLLEVSNSTLPVIDPSTGIKLVKVFVGNDRDVIYTAVVPEALKEIVKLPENKSIIKKNMSKDESFKKMVFQLKDFDISKVKYQYRDDKGNLLQEVSISTSDFK